MTSSSSWRAIVVAGLIAAACSSNAAGPKPPSGGVLRLQDEVEHGLLPIVQVRGEPSRAALADRMAQRKVAAVSIAVFHDYRLVWAKAYGVADRELATEATPATLFQAASISKPVNGLAVLGLAAEGRFDLDAPINSILTGWKLPDNELTAKSPVTLRRLLSHTAGTTVHGFPGYDIAAALPTVPQILDGQAPANSPAVRVDLEPGTEQRYSGGGITITQLAVEETARRPYAEVLRERVLEPLGMIDSTFEQPLPDARRPAAATGYRADGTAVPGRFHVYPEQAAAGLWTTPTDLATFFIEIQRGLAGASKVVSRDLALALLSTAVFQEERNGAKLFGHDGGNDGFQCHALASLEGGFGVVIMTNSDLGHRMIPEIERTVWAAMKWPGADAVLDRVALSAAERAALVGRYLRDGRIVFQVTEREGALWFGVPLFPAAAAVAVSATELVDPTDGKRLRLEASGAAQIGMTGVPGGAPLVRLDAATKVPYEMLAAGDRAGAIAEWKRLAAGPSPPAFADPDLANNLGYALLQAGATDGALSLLSAVTEVFPASANAVDSYGDALWVAGRRDEALDAIVRALAMLDADPTMPAADKPRWRDAVSEKLARRRVEAAATAAP
jgi:CubicO group peptidase (beta-lactamase class C family)